MNAPHGHHGHGHRPHGAPHTRTAGDDAADERMAGEGAPQVTAVGEGAPRAQEAGEGAPRARVAGTGPAPARDAERRRLVWVLAATATFMLAEAAGGLLSGSLALLADAGHMFTDVAALALSLLAMRLAARPPTLRRTFGLVRLEIVAALVNGATLLLMAGLIMLEAWRRFQEPGPIDGGLMLVVAVLGLLVNVAGALLLHGHAHESLNVRGAYLHVLGDLLGSVGTIAAGVIVVLTGWVLADPIVSVAIALLILYSAWNLVREATDVLLESVPPHVDLEAVIRDLSAIEGLRDVHDVHVWTLTSGFVALAAHGVIDDPADHTRVLDQVTDRSRRHGIDHVTFQLELRRLYQLPTAREARGAEGGGTPPADPGDPSPPAADDAS